MKIKKRYALLSGGIDNCLMKSLNKEIIIFNISKEGQLKKILRRICYKLKLFRELWIKSILGNEIENSEDNFLVIFDCYYWLENIEFLKKKYNKVNFVVWYWNKIDIKNNNIKEIKKMNVPIYTFDYNDSKKFNINYSPQFFWGKIYKSETINCDISFVGLDKGRSEKIKKIEKELNSKNLITNFYIFKNSNDPSILSYEEYIKVLKNSKAVLEIPIEKQTGLTLRALEALFYEKKILTTNNNIRNYEWYREENVLILDGNWQDKIEKFLEIPYLKVEEEIKYKYTSDYWLEILENASLKIKKEQL